MRGDGAVQEVGLEAWEFEGSAVGYGDGSHGRHGRARASEGGSGADDGRLQRRSQLRDLRSPRSGLASSSNLVSLSYGLSVRIRAPIPFLPFGCILGGFSKWPTFSIIYIRLSLYLLCFNNGADDSSSDIRCLSLSS